MTRALTIRGRGDVFVLGAFTLKRTGLVVNGKPTFEQWLQCGDALARFEGAAQWWIGDWLNYGAKRYGDKHRDAVEATSRDYQTVANYAWVAGSVTFSRRRENLSFTVHSEVAGLCAAEQERLLEQADVQRLTVRAVRELVRQLAHAEKVARIARGDVPQGEYDVVCADPPWAYGNSGFDQSAAAHYPTLSVEHICRLPEIDPTFPKFATPCVLYLWATASLVPEALAVMQAWGFAYKANIVWIKDKGPSIGWWLDTRHELLLVGVRGATTPIDKPDSVIENTHPHEHSRKPDEAYDAIERMFPGVRKVECFARRPRLGWDVWGNEV